MAYNWITGRTPLFEQIAGGGRTYSSGPTGLSTPEPVGPEWMYRSPELSPYKPRAYPGIAKLPGTTGPGSVTETGVPGWQLQQLWTHPTAKGGIADLTKLWGEDSKSLPSFTDTIGQYLTNQNQAGSAITNAFTNLPTPDVARKNEQEQNVWNDSYKKLINEQTNRYRGIAGDFGSSVEDYKNLGLDALSGEKAVNAKYVAELNDSINRALAQRNKMASRYGMNTAASGGSRGWGSGMDQWLGRSYADALAPYKLEQMRSEAAIASKYLPFYSDYQNRRQQLYPFEMGTEQAITALQADVINRYAGTQRTRQQLELDLQRGALDDAIRYAAANNLNASQIASIYGLAPQLIAQRAAALGQVINLENMASDITLIPPGVETGYQLNPSSYPSRYYPPSNQVDTGGFGFETTPARGAEAAPNMDRWDYRTWPEWMRRQRAATGVAVPRGGQYWQPYSRPIPQPVADPRFVEGPGGSYNPDQFIPEDFAFLNDSNLRVDPMPRYSYNPEDFPYGG